MWSDKHKEKIWTNSKQQSLGTGTRGNVCGNALYIGVCKQASWTYDLLMISRTIWDRQQAPSLRVTGLLTLTRTGNPMLSPASTPPNFCGLICTAGGTPTMTQVCSWGFHPCHSPWLHFLNLTLWCLRLCTPHNNWQALFDLFLLAAQMISSSNKRRAFMRVVTSSWGWSRGCPLYGSWSSKGSFSGMRYIAIFITM